MNNNSSQDFFSVRRSYASSDKKKKKEHKSHPVLWLAALAGIWWFNNYTIKTVELSIDSPKVSVPFKIAVISDQHATKHGISNDSISKKIIDRSPDAVFILGDMYSSGSPYDVMQIPVDLAGTLTENGLTVYFVSGEHDSNEDYLAGLAEKGVHVMNYSSEYANFQGNAVKIMGIDNAYYSPTFDLSTEFSVDGEIFNILMAHIPNFESFSQFGADLTLCADTHGGMIQLPFGMGPVYDTESGVWFPEIKDTENKVFDKGIFDYSGGCMFISSGLGVSPAPVRFNNRPEIDIITIE